MHCETQVLEQQEVKRPHSNGSRRAPANKEREQQRVWDWVRQAASVCERARAGDLQARILGYSGDDDLGRLCTAINDLLDITDAFVRESRASLEYASQGRFFVA